MQWQNAAETDVSPTGTETHRNEPRDGPLSGVALEMWNYVWRFTKAAILRDLVDRATFEDDARIIVNSEVFSCITEMLGTPDGKENLGHLYRLLFEKSDHVLILLDAPSFGNGLASRFQGNSGTEALQTTLSDEYPGVVEWAANALGYIACWVDGVQAIVGADSFPTVFALLEPHELCRNSWHRSSDAEAGSDIDRENELSMPKIRHRMQDVCMLLIDRFVGSLSVGPRPKLSREVARKPTKPMRTKSKTSVLGMVLFRANGSRERKMRGIGMASKRVA
ncbi:hypothetical protein C8R45DRAFT_1074959 [Mycena sanguinolenta]|nr:hypothetical protein C8R45DRAFT_1074959 [Mycena sanguinolenta]